MQVDKALPPLRIRRDQSLAFTATSSMLPEYNIFLFYSVRVFVPQISNQIRI